MAVTFRAETHGKYVLYGILGFIAVCLLFVHTGRGPLQESNEVGKTSGVAHLPNPGLKTGTKLKPTGDHNPNTYQYPLSDKRHPVWKTIFERQVRPGIFDDCGDLFSRRDKTKGLLPADFHKLNNPFLDEMQKKWMYNGFREEGSTLGYEEEALVMWNLAHYIPSVQTVCETGFNTGEGTMVWLSAKPTIKVYSFDIGKHDYARPSARYIDEHFPGRHNITWGDSTETLPQFVASHPDVKCDLILIDGGHTYHVALADFDYFAKIGRNGSVVMMDNYPDYRVDFMQTLGVVWETKRRIGELAEIYKCTYGMAKPQGFSVGILIKQ